MLIVKDFFAERCGPCMMMKPIVEKLIEKNGDVTFEFVDVDEDSKSTTKYGIRSIPSFVLEKDGVVVEKKIGVLSEKNFQKLIDKYK